MNATDCMSCRARGCGAGDVTKRNTATGTVVECRTCGFKLNREERDAIASYYERAIESERMARDVAWVRACAVSLMGGDWTGCAVQDALDLTTTPTTEMLNIIRRNTTDEQIAAAIRAARGAL